MSETAQERADATRAAAQRPDSATLDPTGPVTAPAAGPGDKIEGSATATGSTEESAGLGAIATWTAPEATAVRQVPLSSRTGEPTRVWTVWVATLASYLAVAVLGAATLWVYWDAIDNFTRASWVMGQFETAPGSLGRVLLAVAVTAITLAVGTACAITGYYAYDGRRWTRWFSLIALGLSPLALMLNQLAWAAPVLAALAAGALWLPASARYFAAWQAFRRHDPLFSEPPEWVSYGPLPRYR